MNLVLLMLTIAFTVPRHHPAAVTGAHILAIETCGSMSHWQYMLSIVEPLLAAQHRVTAITPLTANWDRDNYTEIDASSVFPVYGEQDTVKMIERYGTAYRMAPPFPSRSFERDLCDKFYAMPEVRDLMQLGPSSGYDLVLVEPFYSSCLSHLAHTMNVPEIYAVPSPLVTPTEPLYFGTEANPLVVANILYNAGGGSPKTMAQRVQNVALYLYIKFVPWLTDTRMRFFDPKPYDKPTVRHRPAAVFVNTRFITEPPRDFPPNMVQIGGIHLKPPRTVPHDILEFIENSPHGVIYFSFGTVATIKTLPKSIIKMMVEAFEEIPQRVIWRYDGEMDKLPSSIMSRKWLPQREILLHPNVKLFISHGGISGVYEAVDAGVPVLGFPLFYDQPRNVGNLEDAGMAISMDVLTITKDSFLKTLNTLLNDEKYTLNAKHVSKCFKNNSVPSSEEVTSWTDFILAHPTVFRKKDNYVSRYTIVHYNLVLYSTIISTMNLWSSWCC